MESDSWTARFTSKRHQSTLQSRSDLYLAFEEMDGDDDSRAEFSCPFCSEDFDIVGLCCHIDDEHPVEAKSGVCPVCAVRVGMDMVGHITMQHGQFFKMQRRRRFRKGSSGSHSTLSLLRKELREGHLHSLLGGSSCVVPSSTAPDPLLSSFIYNLPMIDTLKDLESHSTDEGSSSKKNVDEKVVESTEPSLSEKDQEEEEEKGRKCEFVQELLLSTFLDDTL
ncbi:protein DEHYDRATION-INDUCED 19 homolog 2-like isoform X1 [Magnolia sinica]|uniref:protein DEHYDRATION-INDUCED 19 homolog 2-like isoform X1 n=1 Tax=Magnolia sinica TaxID=86752 RepID=UPI002657F2DD|nr:protein DEHYDRATION-INDUCED 19 homolog 2-like isoform X1 [Magnolia sinica]